MSLGPNIVIPNAQGIPANGNSMAGNITSQPSLIPLCGTVSYQIVWTGATPVGAVSIQGSNDYSIGRVLNPGHWDTLTVEYAGSPTTSIPIVGNSGSGLIDITATGIYAIRLVYTATSGTGNLIVTVFARGP